MEKERVIKMAKSIECLTNLALCFGSCQDTLIRRAMTELDAWNTLHPDAAIRYKQEEKKVWNELLRAFDAMKSKYMQFLELTLDGENAMAIDAHIMNNQNALMTLGVFWQNSVMLPDEQAIKNHMQVFNLLQQQSLQNPNPPISHKFLQSCMADICVPGISNEELEKMTTQAIDEFDDEKAALIKEKSIGK